MALVALILLAAVAWASPQAPAGRPHHARPTAVIIDTDLSRYWDDTTAIGIANVLQQQDRVQVLAMGTDVANDLAPAALDAINTAYGHPHILIGALAGSAADTEPHGYTDALVAALPHSVRTSADVPDAVTLYRRALAARPDHSVDFIGLGSYTNLARLLASPADRISPLDGRALVARKVERLVVMDGLFFPFLVLPPLTNQAYDLPAAAAVVGDGTPGTGWPTPIAWVDGLTGIFTTVGADLCATAPPKHPMRIVHTDLFGCGPTGDGDWDAPALLFAVGADRELFTTAGRGGCAVINVVGGLSWQQSCGRRDDVYVHVADQAALNTRIDGLLPLGYRPR